MKILSPVSLLVTAALVGITAESAWSEEATPGGSAAPAAQTTAPGTGYMPGWYPPRPNQGGYAQPWQQPPQWTTPPPGYSQPRPYYPRYDQYRGAPVVPRENPLSVKLKQTQEQLAAKTTELDTANEQLATLQAELQAARGILQQAQSETSLASQQLGTAMAEVATLKHVLTELNGRLDTQNTRLQNAVHTAAAENNTQDSAVAGGTEQTQSPATTSTQTEAEITN